MLLRNLHLSLLICLGLSIGGCSSPNCPQGRLSIGIVSYDRGVRSVEQYESFKEYLAKQTCSYVELEPVFNEFNAIEQVKRKNWSLVFAPPGLAAIAINQEQYSPIFPLQTLPNERSVIVVKEDSNIQKIFDLTNKTFALGTPGSAAGYYLPLYDLYGLTLAEIRFAPTPKTILQWLSENQVDGGALSEDEFLRYRKEFRSNQFRILHKTRFIPAGVVLLSPTVERKQEQQIIAAMKQANSSIVGDAGYLPDAKIPDYKQFIIFVNKVKPLEAKLKEKPVVLTPAQTNAGKR
jgi:phosphonate transport system substrate-binding protein